MPDKEQQPDQTKTQDKGRSLSRRSAEPVPADALMALQTSIGNAALGRMLGARNRAADEGPTRVDPATQGAIDTQRSGGGLLDAGLQEQMEGIGGEDLAGVRVHRDPESDVLARGLGATAFTQGRDVFLRSDRDPASEHGRNTLAHELSHVAQGSVGPGAVLREPAPGSPEAEYAASQNNFMAPAPNMMMAGPAGGLAGAAAPGTGGGASGAPGPVPAPYPNTSGGAGGAAPAAGAGPTAGMADPKNLAPRVPDFMAQQPQGLMDQPPEPEPAPANKPKGDTWDIEYSMYGKPESFKGLSDEQAIKKLQDFYFSILGDMRMGLQMQQSWREDMGSSFGSRWAAAASSIAGGADWPDPMDWLEVDKHMFDAFEMLREALWAVMAARNDPGLDKDARAMAKPLTEERLNQIVAILQRGDHEGEVAWNNWKSFLKDTDKGASRTVTGLKVAKVAGAVAATYLTGGLAAEAELGFWGTSLALGAGAGTYGAAQELGNQAGMVWFAGQDSIDWGAVAKAGAVNAAAGFVGGAIGGKFAGLLGNAVGKWIGGMAPEVMEQFGIQGAELLTNGEKIFVQWIAGVGSTPFTSTTSYFLQRGLDGKLSEASVSGLLDQIFQDTVMNAAVSGFLSFAQANGAGHAPAETTTSGAGGESGGTAGGGGGGAEPPAGGGSTPSPRTTSLGMGAAGPAGENAVPGTTLGGPTSEMTAQQAGTADTMQTTAQNGETGTADTARMPAQSGGPPPNVDMPGAHLPTEPMPAGRAPTELQTGVNGPTLPQEAALAPTEAQQAQAPAPDVSTPVAPANDPIPPPPGPGPIQDPVAASRALADASRAGRNFRLIREPAEVQRSWEDEGHSGAAPAAWVDNGGKLNVNSDLVPSPVRSADILSGPIREGAPGEAAPTGGETQMSVAPENNGGEEDYLEETDEPWYNGPSEAPRIETPINDVEAAAKAYWEQMDAFIAGEGRPPATTYAADVYQANWGLAGGEGKAPPAWVDQFGRINVDANQVDVHSRPFEPSGGGTSDGGGGGRQSEMQVSEPGDEQNTSKPDEQPESAPAEAGQPAVGANTPLESEADVAAACQELFKRPVPDMQGRVVFHETAESYAEAYAKRFNGRKPPSRGFYDRDTGQINLAPGAARARLAIHEAVHMMARDLNPDGRMLLGPFLDEGITDWITTNRLGADTIPQGYADNIAFADYLAGKLGHATVENAVLHGDFPTLEEGISQILGYEQATVDEFFGLMRGIERGGNPRVVARLIEMLEHGEAFWGPADKDAAMTRETGPHDIP